MKPAIANLKLALFVSLSLSLLVSTSISQDQSKPPLAFAVIGDTGTGDGAQMAVAKEMVRQYEKAPFGFVLMLGDNIYETGDPKYIKPRFEEPYQDLLAAGVKFYAVLGNHDIIKGTRFQTQYDKFNMGGNRYYKFTKNIEGSDSKIEFFALDTNLMSPEQLSWLEESLKESKVRWKVAFCHHSIYSSSKMHRPYLELRKQLEPLYVKYGVNVVFAGHAHSYERVKPQHGVHYYTEGASGEIKRKTLRRDSPLFAAGEDMVNSFLIVRVTEDEMKVEAIASNGKSIDSSTVKTREEKKE